MCHLADPECYSLERGMKRTLLYFRGDHPERGNSSFEYRHDSTLWHVECARLADLLADDAVSPAEHAAECSAQEM